MQQKRKEEQGSIFIFFLSTDERPKSVSCGHGPIRRLHTESESLCRARCDTEGRLVYHHLSAPVTARCCLTFTDITRVCTCKHTRTHAHLHGTLHPSSRGALAHNVKAENSLAHNHIKRKCNKSLDKWPPQHNKRVGANKPRGNRPLQPHTGTHNNSRVVLHTHSNSSSPRRQTQNAYFSYFLGHIGLFLHVRFVSSVSH